MISEIDFAKKLGTYIRRLRNEKKYSIEKLAAISEMDYSSLNKIENGKQNPTAYTLYKILFALDQIRCIFRACKTIWQTCERVSIAHVFQALYDFITGNMG